LAGLCAGRARAPLGTGHRSKLGPGPPGSWVCRYQAGPGVHCKAGAAAARQRRCGPQGPVTIGGAGEWAARLRGRCAPTRGESWTDERRAWGGGQAGVDETERRQVIVGAQPYTHTHPEPKKIAQAARTKSSAGLWGPGQGQPQATPTAGPEQRAGRAPAWWAPTARSRSDVCSSRCQGTTQRARAWQRHGGRAAGCKLGYSSCCREM
jgi:hypothetical protein